MEVGLHVKRPFFCLILTRLEYPRQSLEKFPNIELHKIPLAVEELFHEHGRTDGQTDRYDEYYSRFSHLCERALQPFLEIYHQIEFLVSEYQPSVLSLS